MTSRVTFISHAVTAAVRAAAFPKDEALIRGEQAKIARLRWNVPRGQEVLTGPEVRARMTAHALGLLAKEDGLLRDCDYGAWCGLGLAEIERNDPEGLTCWLTDVQAKPHRGESVSEVMARIRRWLDGRTSAGHTVAITHPGVIRSAVVLALGAPVEAFWRVDVAPLTLTDIRWNGRAWTVRSVSCALTSSSVLS